MVNMASLILEEIFLSFAVEFSEDQLITLLVSPFAQSVREGLLYHPDAYQPATQPDGAPSIKGAATLGK
jgi:hypothetical protein